MLGGIGKAGRMMGRGVSSFAGHQGGKSFSTMGKMRMGAAAGGAIGMSLRNNQRRGGYNPRSSATGGLQPKSSGGMGVGEF